MRTRPSSLCFSARPLGQVSLWETALEHWWDSCLPPLQIGQGNLSHLTLLLRALRCDRLVNTVARLFASHSSAPPQREVTSVLSEPPSSVCTTLTDALQCLSLSFLLPLSLCSSPLSLHLPSHSFAALSCLCHLGSNTLFISQRDCVFFFFLISNLESSAEHEPCFFPTILLTEQNCSVPSHFKVLAGGPNT